MRTLNRGYLKKPAPKKKPATRGYRSFTDTVNLVYHKLCDAPEPLSHLEIAKLIGRQKKYPALAKALHHMVSIQWLERIEDTSPSNSHLVYRYRAIKYDADGVRIN